MLKKSLANIVILLLRLTIVECAEIINKNVVFQNVERSIDLTSQLVKITTTVSVENRGLELFKNLIWGLDHGATGKLSYISVKDSSKREIPISDTEVGGHANNNLCSINFNKYIVDKNITLTIEEIYVGSQTPYPASITQEENQLVRYLGNHYLYSPYIVQQQTTKIQIPTKIVVNYSELEPFALADGIIIYGPYYNILPFTVDKLTVHFENNSPFLTVTSLKRNIEVSHWGNIAVKEVINLLNSGATLKGSFSRYNYQQNNNSGLNSVKWFKTVLPASVENPYYRDINGNIYTATMLATNDSVELYLRPRFPLFGGWKTWYILGYSIPTYQYLFQNGDNYVLKIRLIDHIFDDMRVDELETTITLPVGASNIKLKTPFEVTRLPDSIAYKYLDIEGRPVVRINKKNLVENHIQDLELSYQWSRVLFAYEPILISVCLYALFLIIIVYVRLDLSFISSIDVSKKQQ